MIKNIQTFCKSVGDSGCLALCYIYACLDIIEPIRLKNYNKKQLNEKLICALLYVYYNTNSLADDMTVLDACGIFKAITGGQYKFTVYKDNYIKGDKLEGYNCVNFISGKNNHWVLYKDGELLFNSLDYSNCVENGVMSDIRRIEWI